VRRNHSGEPDISGLTENGKHYFLRYGDVGYYFSVEDSIADFLRIFPTDTIRRADVHRRLGRPGHTQMSADLSAAESYGDTLTVAYSAANTVKWLEYSARKGLFARQIDEAMAAESAARAHPLRLEGLDSAAEVGAPIIRWEALVGAELTFKSYASVTTIVFRREATRGGGAAFRREWTEYDTADVARELVPPPSFREVITYRELRRGPSASIRRTSHSGPDSAVTYIDYDSGLLYMLEPGGTGEYYGPIKGVLSLALVDEALASASLPSLGDSITFWLVKDDVDPPRVERGVLFTTVADTANVPLVTGATHCSVRTRAMDKRLPVTRVRLRIGRAPEEDFAVLSSLPHVRVDGLSCLRVPTAPGR
jgi:hypothetical protein